MYSKKKWKCKYKFSDMIMGKTESKILTKDISFECKYRFDGRKCDSN